MHGVIKNKCAKRAYIFIFFLQQKFKIDFATFNEPDDIVNKIYLV